MSIYLPALLLLAVTIGSWFVAPAALPKARVHLRFASVLFAALAASAPLPLAAQLSIALFVLPLALAVLALAALAATAQPLPPAGAALILVAVCMAAFGAIFLGRPALALAPAVLAAGAIALLALKRLRTAHLAAVQAMTGAAAFLCAASAVAFGDIAVSAPLFVAAGLLGMSLALARSGAGVEDRAGRDQRGVAIGRAPRG